MRERGRVIERVPVYCVKACIIRNKASYFTILPIYLVSASRSDVDKTIAADYYNSRRRLNYGDYITFTVGSRILKKMKPQCGVCYCSCRREEDDVWCAAIPFQERDPKEQ